MASSHFSATTSAASTRPRLSASCTGLEDARPYKLPGPPTLLRLLRRHRLARLVTEQEFVLVSGFARDRRAQLLIRPVGLSRYVTHRKLGVQHLGAGKV